MTKDNKIAQSAESEKASQQVEQVPPQEATDNADGRRLNITGRWAKSTIALGFGMVLAFGVAPTLADHNSAAEAQTQSRLAVEQLHAEWANSPSEPVPEEDESWATISIPEVGLEDAVVIEGTEAQQINVGVGHYTGTEFPWDGSGNVGLAGHRTGWGELFHELDELSIGDVVIIGTGEATYTYSVTGSTVVDPKETWVLNDLPAETTGAHDGAPTLTLTTCEGADNEKRLIVWAELTDVQTEAST